MLNVFEFGHYKDFLRTWLQNQPHNGRGLKSKLATSLRCRLAYLSRVLNGDADLSPEQALRVAHFVGLASIEARYFRLLVDLGRAGNAELRDAIQVDIETLKKTAYSTKERLRLDQPLDSDAENAYYASWHISAVHIALTIPELDSVDRLSKALRLPREKINQIVTTLIQCGLVADRGGKLSVIKSLMHGDPKGSSARRHLSSWRQKAIEAVQFYEPENFHYSGVVSLSHADFNNIRKLFAESIERAALTIKTSKEETLAAMNIDWFLVTT